MQSKKKMNKSRNKHKKNNKPRTHHMNNGSNHSSLNNSISSNQQSLHDSPLKDRSDDDSYFTANKLSKEQKKSIEFLSEAFKINFQEAHIICNECNWEQSDFPSNTDEAKKILHWETKTTKSTKHRIQHKHNREKHKNNNNYDFRDREPPKLPGFVSYNLQSSNYSKNGTHNHNNNDTHNHTTTSSQPPQLPHKPPNTAQSHRNALLSLPKQNGSSAQHKHRHTPHNDTSTSSEHHYSNNMSLRRRTYRSSRARIRGRGSARSRGSYGSMRGYSSNNIPNYNASPDINNKRELTVKAEEEAPVPIAVTEAEMIKQEQLESSLLRQQHSNDDDALVASSEQANANGNGSEQVVESQTPLTEQSFIENGSSNNITSNASFALNSDFDSPQQSSFTNSPHANGNTNGNMTAKVFKILDGVLVIDSSLANTDLSKPHLCLSFATLLDLINYANARPITTDEIRNWYRNCKNKLICKSESTVNQSPITDEAKVNICNTNGTQKPAVIRMAPEARKPRKPPLTGFTTYKSHNKQRPERMIEAQTQTQTQTQVQTPNAKASWNPNATSFTPKQDKSVPPQSASQSVSTTPQPIRNSNSNMIATNQSHQTAVNLTQMQLQQMFQKQHSQSQNCPQNYPQNYHAQNVLNYRAQQQIAAVQRQQRYNPRYINNIGYTRPMAPNDCPMDATVSNTIQKAAQISAQLLQHQNSLQFNPRLHRHVFPPQLHHHPHPSLNPQLHQPR